MFKRYKEIYDRLSKRKLFKQRQYNRGVSIYYNKKILTEKFKKKFKYK